MLRGVKGTDKKDIRVQFYQLKKKMLTDTEFPWMIHIGLPSTFYMILTDP